MQMTHYVATVTSSTQMVTKTSYLWSRSESKENSNFGSLSLLIVGVEQSLMPRKATFNECSSQPTFLYSDQGGPCSI